MTMIVIVMCKFI